MKRPMNTPFEEMQFFEPTEDSSKRQPLISYKDGGIKKIGERREYLDQPESYIVRTKTNDVYLVEKPRQKPPKRRGRPKRSFVPTNTEAVEPPISKKEAADKFLQFQRENKSQQYNIKADEVDPDDIWKRIESIDEVPKSFYMNIPFDTSINKDLIPKNVPLSPYHLFRLFFDDRLYKLIITNTNTHKKNLFTQLSEDADKKGIDRRFSEPADFNEIDLDGYLSILIAMGVHKMRTPKHYWEKKNYIHSEIACMMKMQKFMEIDRFLSLADSLNKSVQDDIIGKVREYIDLLNENFKRYYYPGEFLSIDEGMIPFTGKVAFKVYNPDKPDKYGIKEFVLCDAKNAYTLETQLYSGNHEEEFYQEFTVSKTNEVVLHLMKDYENRQHKVVMDNYYNSPGLYKQMKEKGIGALGTMRIPRLKLPNDLFTQIMEVHQGKTLSYIQGDVNLAIFFRGTSDKEISMMSSFIDHRTVQKDFWKILADLKEDRPISHEQTQISAYYNKYKGGVDRRNGFLAAYRNLRRNDKWWRPVFYRLFDNAIINAYILYNFNKSPKFALSQKEFRVCLFKQLAARYSPPKSELAIQELNKMRLNINEASERFDYFDNQIQSRILKNCNYSCHQLVKSKTKQKPCSECSVNTYFYCNDCSHEFSMAVPICASGFNQCYDVHASRDQKDLRELFIERKKRSFVREQKERQKQKRKLVRLENLIIGNNLPNEEGIQSASYGSSQLYNQIEDISDFPKSQGRILNSKIPSIFESNSSQEGKKSKLSSKSKAKNSIKNKQARLIIEKDKRSKQVWQDNQEDEGVIWLQNQLHRLDKEDLVGTDKAHQNTWRVIRKKQDKELLSSQEQRNSKNEDNKLIEIDGDEPIEIGSSSESEGVEIIENQKDYKKEQQEGDEECYFEGKNKLNKIEELDSQEVFFERMVDSQRSSQSNQGYMKINGKLKKIIKQTDFRNDSQTPDSMSRNLTETTNISITKIEGSQNYRRSTNSIEYLQQTNNSQQFFSFSNPRNKLNIKRKCTQLSYSPSDVIEVKQNEEDYDFYFDENVLKKKYKIVRPEKQFQLRLEQLKERDLEDSLRHRVQERALNEIKVIDQSAIDDEQHIEETNKREERDEGISVSFAVREEINVRNGDTEEESDEGQKREQGEGQMEVISDSAQGCEIDQEQRIVSINQQDIQQQIDCNEKDVKFQLEINLNNSQTKNENDLFNYSLNSQLSAKRFTLKGKKIKRTVLNSPCSSTRTILSQYQQQFILSAQENNNKSTQQSEDLLSPGQTEQINHRENTNNNNSISILIEEEEELRREREYNGQNSESPSTDATSLKGLGSNEQSETINYSQQSNQSAESQQSQQNQDNNNNC